VRICVYGAGAIGGNLALRLARAGHDVSIVARGEHLAAIRARGLELRIDIEPQPMHAKVHASDRPADLGAQDVVFSTLKAAALPAMAAELDPLLGPETMVAFLQNGIPWWYDLALPADLPAPPDLGFLDPGGALHRKLGAKRTLGGIAYPSSEVVAPGVVRILAAGRHDILVAELDDSASPRITELRATLEAAGIPSPVVPDIRHASWNKLLINASVSTLCALAGHPMAILDRDPDLRSMARAAFVEVLAIATANGMRFEVDPEALFGPGRSFSQHKPSILQDRERNRPMEIDALLKAPLASAHARGVPAPTLEAIAALLARLGSDMGVYGG